MEKERTELKVIFSLICIVFLGAVACPLVILFSRSFIEPVGSFGFANYIAVWQNEEFTEALQHSFAVSGFEALITVVLAFVLAYGLHFTNLPHKVKSAVQILIILPMFLPTLTYGFAVIYSLGKQGLITQILGQQLFPIYGFLGIAHFLCHLHAAAGFFPVVQCLCIRR